MEEEGESTRDREKGVEVHRRLWEEQVDINFRRCWNDLWDPWDTVHLMYNVRADLNQPDTRQRTRWT